MPLDFDPNAARTRAPAFPKWATYCPDRTRQKWKVHTQRGHALNALAQHRDIILYEFVDEEWIERFRVEDSIPSSGKVTNCEDCGENLWVFVRSDYSWYNERDEEGFRGYWRFKGYERWRDDPLTRIGYCYTCIRKHR